MFTRPSSLARARLPRQALARERVALPRCSRTRYLNISSVTPPASNAGTQRRQLALELVAGHCKSVPKAPVRYFT
jgi:hypothetical protein